ncbi:glutamine amidotransferase [Candidatus Saccharibacteria bacterium]|nr:glutamine amidotransferase [Candidatus Saccharibacteria bacterium]
MKPFFFFFSRPEDKAADNEYEAFMKFGDLNPEQLRQVRIHSGQLPKLNLSNYSGIFIGGGPYCVSDLPTKKSTEQKKCEAAINKIMDEVAGQDFPLLAACYIGVVIEHQGGVISRQYPEVIGGYKIELSQEGKQDKLLKDLPDGFVAFSGHKESCDKLPANSVVLAYSSTCPTQLLRIKNNIYACQFHPELDNIGLALRIQIYKNYGYFPPEDAGKLVKEAAQQAVIEPVKILRNFVKTYQ